MKLHLAELSRRGVFKTLAAYAVASWVLTEVVSVIGEGFLLPSWSVAAVTTILVLGAFPVILLSWRYDFTLEGIQRDSRKLSPEVEKSARTISGLIIFVLLSITAALWANYFRAQSANEVDLIAQAQQGAPEIGADGQILSIAVLPFDDYSPGGGKELLADGIAEAILHALAQEKNLVVTSRKSSFMFRDKDISAAEIGRILNVQSLLEGSIQIVNDQLRVTSQLIRTSDQAHIWSDVYEAPLDDLFKVNDEIASKVRELILPRTQPASDLHGQPHPPSVEAFQLLLEARALIGDMESTERAIRLINVIIELWPDYADAWAWLAMARNDKLLALRDSHSASYSEMIRIQEKRLKALETALLLNPANHLAILLNGLTAPGGGLRGYHEAIVMVMELAPNDPDVLNWLAGLHIYVANFQSAEKLLSRARAVDPANNDVLESYLLAICGAEPAVPVVEAQLEDYATSRIKALNFRALAQFCDRQIAESIKTTIKLARIDNDSISPYRSLMLLAALGHQEALALIPAAHRILPAEMNGYIAHLFDPSFFPEIQAERLENYRRYIKSELAAGHPRIMYAFILMMAGDYANAEKNLYGEKVLFDQFYAFEGGRFWQSDTLTVYAYLAWFLAQRGEHEQASAIADELLQDLESKNLAQWSGSQIRLGDLPLMILLLNDHQQQAVEWLLEAESDRWLGFQAVLTSPVYAAFRDIPEVAESLSRMVQWRAEVLGELMAAGLPEVQEPALLLEMIASLARPTHHEKAQMALHFDDDPATALRHYENALKKDPGNPAVLQQAADLALEHGLVDEAILLGERAVSFSPMDSSVHYFLSYYYACAQRWSDAIASVKKALELSPESSVAQRWLGLMLILNGEAQKAMDLIEQIPDEMHRGMGLVPAHCALGQKAESEAVISQWIEVGAETTPFLLAYSLAYCGEPDRAFEWLYKASSIPAWVSNAAVHPMLLKLHDDPRWLPFLESIGKSPEQLAGIELNATLPE